MIENLSDAFLKDVAKATLTKQDYTLSESAEKRILESLAEIENARQNGTLQTFSKVEALME